MAIGFEEIAPTADEAALGFAVHALAYEDDYELPFPRVKGRQRVERCVALVVDAENRLRRRHAQPGYAHERLGAAGWRVVAGFESLAEVAESDIYRAHARQSRDAGAAAGRTPEENEDDLDA